MKSKLIRKVTTVVLSAAMVMSAITISAPVKTVKASPTTSSTLVWSDEFNGSSIDTSNGDTKSEQVQVDGATTSSNITQIERTMLMLRMEHYTLEQRRNHMVE